MLGDANLVAFVATARPDEARAFYRDALGLTLIVEDGFALVFAASSVTIRVVKVETVEPVARTVLGWEVANAAETAAALRAAGVRFENFAGLEMDGAGLWHAPGGALVGWFRDPDGNLLSITQQPETRAGA